MSVISPEKRTALTWVDANQKRLSDFHLEIWRYAETAFYRVLEKIDPGMFVAGKTIGATLVDLLTSPEALARATAEFKERIGGGAGGSKWLAPLLPRDFIPPVDLRWPEYVTTPRGEEWWIPTPHPGLG